MNTVNQIEANTGKLQIKEQIMKDLEQQFKDDPTQENAEKWQEAENDFNDALKQIDVPIFFDIPQFLNSSPPCEHFSRRRK